MVGWFDGLMVWQLCADGVVVRLAVHNISTLCTLQATNIIVDFTKSLLIVQNVGYQVVAEVERGEVRQPVEPCYSLDLIMRSVQRH